MTKKIENKMRARFHYMSKENEKMTRNNKSSHEKVLR